MFKRLWWAGSRSRFTAVDWRGDYSQVGGFAPNYWANVVHALKTAPALADLVNALPGEKVMLAHSLGNVLTSEACKCHALSYSRYYMLNAAVPAEAYDAGQAEFGNMTPTAWKRYPKSFRSSDWHKLFESDDGRCALTWRGRYANLANAVNCHSPTEDVLANVASGLGSAWSAQELLKGTGTLAFMPRVASEAGWWFNQQHTVPLSKDDLLKTEFTPDEMKTSPPFSPFADKWLHTTNAVAAAQVADILPRILADGIPATTFAAGANEIGGVSGNVSFHGLMSNEAVWPKGRQEDVEGGGKRNVWQHSDIKNLAYFYVYRLFELIVESD